MSAYGGSSKILTNLKDHPPPCVAGDTLAGGRHAGLRGAAECLARPRWRAPARLRARERRGGALRCAV